MLAGRARASGAWLDPPSPNHPCIDTGARTVRQSDPVLDVSALGPSVEIEGLPFSPEWGGDWFPDSAIPFHSPESVFPGGQPPTPSESVDIAIVGGGLSGLATAYLLRAHRPVVLELNSRMGGTSMGERWRGTDYSLGGAYFITADEGDFLDRLYTELGVYRVARESPPGDDQIELMGAIAQGFWQGQGLPAQQQQAFAEYALMVQRYVDLYPDIPLDPDADNQWILDLDAISLRDYVTRKLTVPVPDLLAAGIQGYCYSSFNAGWEEVSAASGWNFLAAEEYGRLVMPGGNAGLVRALWDRLREHDQRLDCPGRLLRAGCRAVDVRVLGPERVQVTYKDRDGAYRSLMAKRVVMCCPKHVARHVLHGLEQGDPERAAAISRIQTSAYVVANVLLNRQVRRDFYDLFLLRDGSFPPVVGVAEDFNRATDALRGDFARPQPMGRSVLTFYWPMPFGTSRVQMINRGLAWHAERFAPLLRDVLGVLSVDTRHVRQVRLARWGHAMPIATPGLISEGVCERVRAPYQDHVFFVHQDNWALPAVETCLLEAEAFAPLIREGL
jgi:hypothetical protein